MRIEPLDIFNFLVPKDGNSRLVAGDVAYGQDARLRLDIYAPASRERGPLPVVVFFYGGSWDSGKKSAYAFVGRALAALGYVVVVPDYRLLPHVEYPVFLRDCVAALDWVSDTIAAYGGDADRLLTAGHSAGAYNAVMAVLDRSLGLSARVRAVAGLSGPYDFYPFDGPVSLRVFGQAEDAPATQPVNHVWAGAPPMFLATGEDDRMVLPRNSDRLTKALSGVGVAAEARHYPGIDHAGMLLALSRPLRSRAAVLADMAAFFERVMADQT